MSEQFKEAQSYEAGRLGISPPPADGATSPVANEAAPEPKRYMTQVYYEPGANRRHPDGGWLITGRGLTYEAAESLIQQAIRFSGRPPEAYRITEDAWAL